MGKKIGNQYTALMINLGTELLLEWDQRERDQRELSGTSGTPVELQHRKNKKSKMKLNYLLLKKITKEGFSLQSTVGD
jgi:hypothetical protein